MAESGGAQGGGGGTGRIGTRDKGVSKRHRREGVRGCGEDPESKHSRSRSREFEDVFYLW